MIKLLMKGMLGNNLFQYAFARILAEDLGYALEVTHSTYNLKSNVPHLKELLISFSDAPLSIPGKSFAHPVDKTASMDHQGFDGYHIDLNQLLNCRQDRKIVVNGFFERYEIFRRHKKQIRSWFAVDPINLGYSISDNDIVLHIRRGDFIIFERAISLGFYVDILDNIEFNQLYICGYGLDREVRDCFQHYHPIYIHRKPVDDFRFIKGFNRIVQSQSTFAWWAGFLSEAEEIYAPVLKPTGTEFERKYPHIDLQVDDEDRYRYIANVLKLGRKFSFRDIFAARNQLSRNDMVLYLKELIRNRFTGVKS